jgi:hypothetical protein
MKPMKLLMWGLVLSACLGTIAVAQVPHDPSSSQDYVAFTVSGGNAVTSVGMTVPSIMSVAGSPVTSSGTLAVSLATESANTCFAGPSSGSAATPTFRALAANDIPGTLNATAAPSFTVNPNTGSFTFVGSTAFTAPANGTAQITKADGTFATLLFGAAGSTTGVKIIPGNATLTITDGAGGSTVQLLVTSASISTLTPTVINVANGSLGSSASPVIRQNAVQTSGMYFPSTTAVALTSVAGTGGTIQLSGVNTGAMTFTQATGTLSGPGFLFNGAVEGMSKFSIANNANVVLTAAQSGSHITNIGAAGGVQVTLPAPAKGLNFTIKQIAGFAMNIITPSGTIQSGALTTGTTRVISGSALGVLSITCEDGTNWHADYASGTITWLGFDNVPPEYMPAVNTDREEKEVAA